MRKLLITHVKPGMILAKTIFTTNGAVLLSAGTRLRANYIEGIKAASITSIYVEDDLSKGIMVEDLVSDETKYAAKRAIEESIKKSKSGTLLNSEAIKHVVKGIVQEIMLKPTIMINLQDIRAKDEYLFAHSVNVCVLSVLIGKQMGYSYDKLRELAIGALMHDIGKVKLDKEYYCRKKGFKDEEVKIYETHTKLGYEMLKKSRELSLVSDYIALAHHEKYDGSGFPLKLKGEKIHEFAQIVALINEYDNLLHNPSYEKDRMKHYEILEYIVSRAYTDFDPKIIKVFQQNISLYPAGTGVVLNTGEKALVVHVNPKAPSRPTIRIVFDKNDMLIQPREVDLMKDLTVFITDSIELS
jgi:putative nucleotidyltransferase with HDIG domain